jgi:SOS response regulatory protein OraA/RecX
VRGRPPRGGGAAARRRSPSPQGTVEPQDPASAARAALVRAFVRLGYRDQSSAELRRALTREGFETEAVDAVLERLLARRLLDDTAFAERLARRSLGRGLGRKRIALALGQRGVPREVAQAGLTQALELVPEAEVLETVAQRYWLRQTRLPPAVRARRLFAFLVRRGFPVAAVLRETRRLCPSQAELVENLATEEP